MIKKLLVTVFFALSLIVITPAMPAQAQAGQNDGVFGICDFIGPICEAIGFNDSSDDIDKVAENFITTRLSLLLGLMFVGITLLAIFIIIQAGVQYIQSQGNEEKIVDAQKSIKSVFVGLAVLIVGIVGVILVIFFLGGGTGFFGLGAGSTDDCVVTCTENGGSTAKCISQCQKRAD